MTIKVTKICKDIVDEYKQDSNVIGILLFGSFARNKADDYSDVDIYILLNKKGKYSRKNYIHSGLRVDIIMDTRTESKKFLLEDKFNVHRNTSHMLAHGLVLYSVGSDLDKILKLAKQNLKLKTKYHNNEILMHKYSIDDFWGEVQRDLKNKDYLAWSLDSALLVNNMIDIVLKLNGEYWHQPNEMSKILFKIDKKFVEYLDIFSKEIMVQKKNIILSTMIKHVYALTSGELSDSWHIKNK